MESLPGASIIPEGLAPEELASRGMQLAMAGITGVREGPTRRDAETVAMLFDTMRLSVNRRHGLRRPTVFAWEFTDPDISDWQVIVDNGSSRAEQGSARPSDLRLRVSYQDWVDIVGGRLDPRRAVLSGRLRPRGNPLGLLKLQRAFPQ